MDVTLSGMVTEVRRARETKAPSAMAVTRSPFNTAGRGRWPVYPHPSSLRPVIVICVPLELYKSGTSLVGSPAAVSDHPVVSGR